MDRTSLIVGEQIQLILGNTGRVLVEGSQLLHQWRKTMPKQLPGLKAPLVLSCLSSTPSCSHSHSSSLLSLCVPSPYHRVVCFMVLKTQCCRSQRCFAAPVSRRESDIDQGVANCHPSVTWSVCLLALICEPAKRGLGPWHSHCTAFNVAHTTIQRRRTHGPAPAHTIDSDANPPVWLLGRAQMNASRVATRRDLRSWAARYRVNQ